MSQLAFFVNTDTCLSCKSCGLSCKDKNNLTPGRKFRKIYSQCAGSWSVDASGATQADGVFSYSVSIGCNHCVLPLCLASCPVQAIVKRDDGIVYIDQELCIGCGACATACPYTVPSLDEETNTYGKCDFCMDLIDRGESPICTRACPVSALDYGDIEELRASYPDTVQQVAPLPDADLTSPSLLIKAHRRYQDGLATTVINLPEEIRSDA